MTNYNYNRSRQAGDTEHQSSTSIFYLAPLPLITGVAVTSPQQLHQATNEVYLDFAMGVPKIEFSVRCYLGVIVGIALFIFTICLGLGALDHINTGRPVFEIVVTAFSPNWPIWGFFSFLISSYSLFLLQAIHQISTPPIRFNRQRREVAYVAKRGQPPRFIPWEEVIACVSSSTVATQYGTQQKFALMIGFIDASDGQVMWLTLPTSTLGMAVSEWEAIRAYMEEGPSALRKPMMGTDLEEGTVAFFHMCRRDYLLDHGCLRYLFGFLLIQFFSGWTLPCHVASWVKQLPKTAFPKAVQDWSKPLPREQWQSPSAELIKESEEVRKSLRKGMSIFDYFLEKEKNQSKTGV
ncbi:hypothetical protein ALP63_100777 [Pseudomonas syringae pv. aceris]|jgi:hypothetical protein|uniref:DUF6708 domain-containing protein n=2 Tax=Pseudomonas TaxID=286 RepID=UPI000F3CC888|nr:DUF6708 domain-containing protein [Pseudomonas syringae]RMS21643.1 hypothetical protein ALP69_100642 [Pseudomonas syringae pv. aceris]RMS63939.1 hypothetical protein ALP63_100777 [Pseudomonas syringae pv. aceris]RMS65039.1 hypothetical protein ALP62_03234 [Pseudomonas syringae pv. aceris]